MHEKQIKTEIIKSVFKPRFYIGNGITFGEGRTIENISIEANISTKRLLIGGGIGVNTQTKKAVFPVRVAFKF